MATETFVLPGDSLDSELLPSHPTLPLRLGPGLRHIPPSTITPTVAGQLCTDARKNAVWIEYNGGRYIPTIGDLVIATVQRSAVDVYYASISDFTSAASLPQLSFEGATKKTRPQLSSGSLVYARITLANKHMDPELECVSSSTGKSEGLGPLTGGMLFDVSLGMARRLMMTKPVEQGRVVVLEELGGLGVAFEIAVGRNGKVWVDSKNTKSTLAVGRAIQETDEKGLKIEEQKKLARKLVKDL
ncbi:putative exosome complex exonuclease RRP40 [Coleophoma crateriformis]|uniref:Ribosomal RNA-processing protein 40 n=1 Tax=Coleophoma crateriformis TaxID=565419 RepID=A0A3D8QI40_9HELO|nr:putative exosome complex exonuclease RRP40 [Coleophoma crateriformis]